MAVSASRTLPGEPQRRLAAKGGLQAFREDPLRRIMEHSLPVALHGPMMREVVGHDRALARDQWFIAAEAQAIGMKPRLNLRHVDKGAVRAGSEGNSDLRWHQASQTRAERPAG